MKFGMNSVVFLLMIVVTVVAWIGFEYYHQNISLDIPSDVKAQADSPLPNSFDKETLKQLYSSKSNFYEYKEEVPSPTPTEIPQ